MVHQRHRTDVTHSTFNLTNIRVTFNADGDNLASMVGTELKMAPVSLREISGWIQPVHPNLDNSSTSRVLRRNPTFNVQNNLQCLGLGSRGPRRRSRRGTKLQPFTGQRTSGGKDLGSEGKTDRVEEGDNYGLAANATSGLQILSSGRNSGLEGCRSSQQTTSSNAILHLHNRPSVAQEARCTTLDCCQSEIRHAAQQSACGSSCMSQQSRSMCEGSENRFKF